MESCAVIGTTGDALRNAYKALEMLDAGAQCSSPLLDCATQNVTLIKRAIVMWTVCRILMGTLNQF